MIAGFGEYIGGGPEEMWWEPFSVVQAIDAAGLDWSGGSW